MRRIFMAMAGFTAIAAAPAPAPAPRVADFAWLSGAWVARDGDKWTEEWWTPPRGGIMIGAGFSGQGDKAAWFEHMRIMADKDGSVGFFGMPGGAPAARFALVRGGKGEAVFENPAHDFPQRVHYRMDGETLVATVSMLDGSKAQSWRFRRGPAQ